MTRLIGSRVLTAAMALLTLALVACSSQSPGSPSPSRHPDTGPADTDPPATTPPPVQPSGTETTRPAPGPALASAEAAASVVRFRAETVTVEVTIAEDTPTSRSLLAQLPMTVPFRDFNGREKVTDLAQPLDYRGAAGMTPRNGDLFSYLPWGNLGFFYRTDGMSHSDDLVRIGTTDAALDDIKQLDGHDVTIELVNP